MYQKFQSKRHQIPAYRVYEFKLVERIHNYIVYFPVWNLMSKQGQNVKPTPDANTPPNVIANAARFNAQFNNIQIGGNPITVSIGRLLTVLGEQDNTIRILSKAIGRNYNERQMHDMHNSLFGGLLGGSGTWWRRYGSSRSFNSDNHIHKSTKSTDSGTYYCNCERCTTRY